MRVVGQSVNDKDICHRTNDRDEFFDLLKQGYIGTQSGNYSRIYFMGERPDVVFASTLQDRFVFETPKFGVFPHSVMYAALGAPRKYYTFEGKDIKLKPVQREIQRLQGSKYFGNPFKKFREELKKQEVFNEELL
jgi:hypothetical protein